MGIMKSKVDYTHLNTKEKIALVEEIWDSISDETIPLSLEHKEILRDRLKMAETSKSRLSWENVKHRLREKIRK